MNQKTIFTISTFLLFSLFLASGILATPNFNNTCRVSNQIRTVDQMMFQNPHFTCDKCTNTTRCPNQTNVTIFGDTLSKHITLTDPLVVGAHAEADIDVFNFKGLDDTNIKLRVTGLKPYNGIFSAFLVGEDPSVTLPLGNFYTNSIGRGYLNFRQNLLDYNDFEKLVVYNSNNTLVLTADVDFTCLNGQDIDSQ